MRPVGKHSHDPCLHALNKLLIIALIHRIIIWNSANCSNLRPSGLQHHLPRKTAKPKQLLSRLSGNFPPALPGLSAFLEMAGGKTQKPFSLLFEVAEKNTGAGFVDIALLLLENVE